MESHYRFTQDELFGVLDAWDKVIPGRGPIRLIACGGSALTLMGYKPSTKDIDFLVPVEKEYIRLTGFLKAAGYEQTGAYRWRRPAETLAFDLFMGKVVYQTELLSSPLEKNGNRRLWKGRKIYLGVLNPVDLMITKMFRGTQVDLEDCMTLFRHEAINRKALEKRYRQTASYDVSEQRVLKNLDWLLRERDREVSGIGVRKGKRHGKK